MSFHLCACYASITLNITFNVFNISYIFQDINECKDETPCQENADCHNLNGTYTCKCSDGYLGNETLCYGKFKLTLHTL